MISGQWSGAVSGSVSATSSTIGAVSFKSPSTSTRGYLTFTVTGISATGYAYDTSRNLKSSASISY